MSDKWEDKPWQAGTEVEVFDVNFKKLGVGVLLNDYIPATDDDEDVVIPKIKLGDGTILGSDCYWIPTEVAQSVKKGKELQEYTVNVTVKGYDGLAFEVKVPGTDPDDAFSRACSQEPRYQDDDPYLLLVLIGEEDSSVFCTYPDLVTAAKHIKTIRGGRWFLVKRDEEEGGEGAIIKAWHDDD